MKIICIDGNYENIGGADAPVFFLKPESAILRSRLPFFIPDHTHQVVPRINIVLCISRLGKNIQKKFAQLYYDKIGLGIDMEAADVLAQCKAGALPWEAAKAFDCSCPIGSFIPSKEIKNISDISFSLFKNNVCIAQANSGYMRFGFDDIIAHVSKYMTLKTGDYIFTGSPPLNESVSIDDHITGYIDDRKMISFNVK